MPLLPPNYAQKAQIQSRISGVTTPDIKTMTGQVGDVFATQLNPTRIVKVAQQGDSNRTILTKGTGSCGAVSTHNTPMAIPYLTSQMLDSYGLPVEWGPQADDKIRIEYSTPGNPLALHRVKPNVSKLPLTGLTVGKGLVKVDYGKYDYTDPHNVTHTAPGTADPVVQKPKLQVELATVSSNPASGLMFGGTDTNGVMLDLATVAGVNISGLLMNGGDDLNGLIANVDGTSIVIDPTTHKITATGTGGSGGPTGNLIARRGVHIDFTATPTETVTLALHAGTELTDATPYLYAVSYVTLAKETPIGPSATITTTTGNQEVSVTLGAVNTTTYPDVVSRNLYRSHNGGTTWHLVHGIDLTAQTYLDANTDTVVDANQQPPTTNDTVIETWLKPLTSGLVNTAGTDGNRLAIATTNTGTALAIPSGTGLLTVQVDGTTIGINPSNQLVSLSAGDGVPEYLLGNPGQFTGGSLPTPLNDSLLGIGYQGSAPFPAVTLSFGTDTARSFQRAELAGLPNTKTQTVSVVTDLDIAANDGETWWGPQRPYRLDVIRDDSAYSGAYATLMLYGNLLGLDATIGTYRYADHSTQFGTQYFYGDTFFSGHFPIEGTPATAGNHLHVDTGMYCNGPVTFNVSPTFASGVNLPAGSTLNTQPILTNPVNAGLVVSPTSSGSTPLTVNNSTGTPLLTTSPAGGTTLTSTDTTSTTLAAYAPSTTTGSLFALGTTSGGTTTPLVTVTPTTTTIGTATASNDVTINGDLSVLPTNPLSVSVIVNAPAAQSALLTDWKVNGVHKASVSASGVVDATGYTINDVPLGTAKSWSILTDGNSTIIYAAGDVIDISY